MVNCVGEGLYPALLTIATVAAGTMTPPRPKQASVPKAMVVTTFVGSITARDPPKQVSIPAATNRIHLQSPGKVLRSAFQNMAPMAVAKPADIPRRPIKIGTGSQTVDIVRGQKFSKEKKFMPATKATANDRATTRWPLKSSLGIIGYGANFASQITQVKMSAKPMKKVQST